MRIVTNSTTLRGIVQVPASKSLSNRALMIKAYLNHDSRVQLDNLSNGTDCKIMQSNVTTYSNYTEPIVLNCADAGTVFRFMLPLLASAENKRFTLTGTKRLLQRPIMPLVEALRALGASIDLNTDLSLSIEGRRLRGGKVQIDASQSSQFVSALCLLAPTLPGGLSIETTGQRVSFPYIRMTLDVMGHFGVHYREENNTLIIPEQAYEAKAYRIENDWSSAAFYYAMGLFCKQLDLFLPGLTPNSIQGDSYVSRIATQLGIQSTFSEQGVRIQKLVAAPLEERKALCIDYTDYPDLAVPFIVACAVLFPEVRSTGIHHLNLKESERLQALQIELKKLGYTLQYHEGVLSCLHERTDFKHSLFNLSTYHDHRLAMAFSMLAFTGKVIVIDDAACVRKSFPQFWGQLSELGLSVY